MEPAYIDFVSQTSWYVSHLLAPRCLDVLVRSPPPPLRTPVPDFASLGSRDCLAKYQISRVHRSSHKREPALEETVIPQNWSGSRYLGASIIRIWHVTVGETHVRYAKARRSNCMHSASCWPLYLNPLCRIYHITLAALFVMSYLQYQKMPGQGACDVVK